MIQRMFDLDKLRTNLATLMDGMSANELARRSGVQQTTISRMLAGKIEAPGIDHLCNLAEYFGVTVSQLIGEKPLKTPDYSKLENVMDKLPEYRRNTVINVAQDVAHSFLQEPEAPYNRE